ncbi:MAG: serine/threonine protein kinase, partial [Tepidisphaeraceae bacterium]
MKETAPNNASLPSTQSDSPAIDTDQLRAAHHEMTSDDPQSIGPYRILELLGSGGFGEVYKAERRHPMRQTVAIKVIKLGFDTREIIARFNSERQALARMDHPNVAKVLDAGTTDTGRPYFVMEYVPGEPITQFCDVNKLSIKD